MAPSLTPSRRGKRAQPEADIDGTQSASTAKKRRLNGNSASSPLTPRARGALASAVPGSLGSDRRGSARGPTSNGRTKITDDFNEPESDGEPSEAPSETNSPTKKRGRNLAKAASSAAIYDVPDSDEDEIGVGSGSAAQASQLRKSRTQTVSQSQAKSSRASPSLFVASNVASAKGSVTPSKLRSNRGLNGDDENEPTPSRRIVGGWRAPAQLTDVEAQTLDAPKLKGILTPSKRRGIRSHKSVVFDDVRVRNQREVFFEDLPSKSAQKAPNTTTVTAEEQIDEDDDVCAICSKPDSAPPNEIVFCDGCDQGYHQECHGLLVIPKGAWLCRNCDEDANLAPSKDSSIAPGVKKSKSSTGTAVSAQVPKVPNFEEHLRAAQRLLLDRCTGKQSLKMRGQDEAYKNAFQLVEQTVLAGEGNSILVIGARGSGKTTFVNGIIDELSKEHRKDFHVVRLNGFIHTDDKLALKEIWRQLGREMDVDDELVKKTHNHADTLASLLAVLSHPSEISGAAETSGVMSKSVIFIMDEFDLFATHARQTLLYNLFDIAQARKAPIAVVGLTCRVDVVESLEKRVKSRFSHRHVHLSLPKNVSAYWEICRQGLIVDEEDLELAGASEATADATPAARSKGRKAFCDWWNKHIEELRRESSFQDHLEFHFYSSKSVSAFLTSCVLPLSAISPSAPRFQSPGGDAAGGMVNLDAPDSKLELLESLSDLDLALLISAARLDIVAHTDTVNFAMAYDEYTSLIGRQRVQTATSGVFALGGAARAWGRGVAGTAWERLASVGLLTPAAGAGLGRGGGAFSSGASMGLGAKMWKVDVALEEIPSAAALKPASILARWCREI